MLRGTHGSVEGAVGVIARVAIHTPNGRGLNRNREVSEDQIPEERTTQAASPIRRAPPADAADVVGEEQLGGFLQLAHTLLEGVPAVLPGDQF